MKIVKSLFNFQYSVTQNYMNLLSHLPSFTSAVNSLGVFPSILIPNDPHVPTICFATDF